MNTLKKFTAAIVVTVGLAPLLTGCDSTPEALNIAPPPTVHYVGTGGISNIDAKLLNNIK